MKLTWYFDFISPFAYIQHCQFERLPESVEVEYQPILLAGLLAHWNNVGPAEVPPKRIFTYKHCYWRAKSLNIPFKMPPAHPFNSLFALRLCIATGNQKETVQTIFDAIWAKGFALDSPECIAYIESRLGLKNVSALTEQSVVKDLLRMNTEQAANENVFGVPTFVPEQDPDQQFWGFDAFDMLLDYISTPDEFNNEEMRRLESLPESAQRNRHK